MAKLKYQSLLDNGFVLSDDKPKPDWNATSGEDAEILNKPDLSIYSKSANLGNILFVSSEAPAINNSQTRVQAVGRIDRPFRTINAAHIMSTDNDIIYVLAGDYTVTSMSVSNANRSSRFILDNCNITITSNFLNITGSGYARPHFISLINSNMTTNQSIISGIRPINVFGNNNLTCSITSTSVTIISSLHCLFRTSVRGTVSNLTINSFGAPIVNGTVNSTFVNCIINCAFFTIAGQWVHTFENCYLYTSNNFMSGTSQTYGLHAKNCTIITQFSTTAQLSILKLKNCELSITGTFINELAITNAVYFIIENCKITCDTLISKNSINTNNNMQFLNNVFKCNKIINNPSNIVGGNYNFVNNISNINFDSFELTNPANRIINHNTLNLLDTSTW